MKVYTIAEIKDFREHTAISAKPCTAGRIIDQLLTELDQAEQRIIELEQDRQILREPSPYGRWNR